MLAIDRSEVRLQVDDKAIEELEEHDVACKCSWGLGKPCRPRFDDDRLYNYRNDVDIDVDDDDLETVCV